jgi:hypothetical protein
MAGECLMMQNSFIRKRNPLRIFSCLGGGKRERGVEGRKRRMRQRGKYESSERGRERG